MPASPYPPSRGQRASSVADHQIPPLGGTSLPDTWVTALEEIRVWVSVCLSVRTLACVKGLIGSLRGISSLATGITGTSCACTWKDKSTHTSIHS